MPRYTALIYASPAESTNSPEQWAQMMVEYNDFGDTAGAAGVLGGGEALQDTSTDSPVTLAWPKTQFKKR